MKQSILIFLGSNLLQCSLCSKPHWSPFSVWLVSAAHAGVHVVRAVGKNRRGSHLCERAKIRERRAGRRASAAASQQPHVGNTRGVRHGRGLDGCSNSRAPASTVPPEHSFRKMRARGRFQSTPPIGRGTKGRRPRRSIALRLHSTHVSHPQFVSSRAHRPLDRRVYHPLMWTQDLTDRW